MQNLKFKSNDCYPVDLVRDFMSSRLPPFNNGLNEEKTLSISELGNIQSLHAGLSIRLVNAEHVCVVVESQDEDQLDNEDDASESQDSANEKYKLLIVHSLANLRENHMMSKVKLVLV